MHSYKSYLLILLLYLCSMSLVQAQNCTTPTISPNGPGPVCQGTAVTLTANSAAGLTLRWFKDGVLIPNATGATFQAVESGSYTVEADGPTCDPASSIPVTVTVNPLPAQPDFILNPNTPQCSGSPINFSITSPQPNTSYVWDFGDGTTTVGNSVNHTYKTVGVGAENFPVVVYAVSQAGCISPTRTQNVTVNRKPRFTPPTDSSNFNVCIPDTQKTVSVKAYLTNNNTSGDVTSYIVDFGDGAGPQTFLPQQFTSTQAIQNTIPYDTTGSFPITIRAIGANGCDSVYTKNFEINKKPEAEFDANSGKKRLNPANCTPVIIAIADTSRGGNLTYRYRVTNNQGQPASGVSFIQGTDSTSQEPVLQFDVEGRYNIRLIVSNSCGTDTATQSVLIARPEVNLFADSTSCGPATILFDAQKVNYDLNLGNTEKNFRWTVSPNNGVTFVNGTSPSSKFPEIRFANVGEYKVNVVFENECGNSRDFEQQPAEATITINAVPGAVQFTPNNVTICSGDSTTIRPTGPGTNFEFYTQQTGGTSLGSGREFKTGTLLTTTVYYVAAKNAQNCESPTRTAFTVNVVPEMENNTITLAQNQQELCAGQPFPGAISGSLPTGGTGSYQYKWQTSQTGNPTDFRDAAGSNTARNYTPAQPLTVTTWFRRLVTSGSCSADTSDVVMVTVTPPITNNTVDIEGDTVATICQGAEAPQITGSQPAATATIIWESSTVSATAGFASAAGINGEVVYSPGALSTTTWFRRRINQGGCTAVSDAVRVIVIPPVANNTIQGEQTICSTGTAPAALTGSVPTGGGTANNRVILWESSLTGNPDDFGPAAGANNGQNYTPQVLTQTTYFRRTVSVREGGCDPNRSNVVVITVVPPITDNNISSIENTVCQGKTVAFTGTPASGGGGAALEYLWETSTTSATAGFNPAAGTNNTQDYTPPFISQNTWFRRTVRVPGATCPPNVSNVIAITVEKAPSAPTVEASNVQTCPEVPATLRVTNAGAGNTYEWFTQETGGTPVFVGAEFTTNSLSATTTYYVQAVSPNQCASANRTSVRVSIIPVVADAGRDTTIIQGQSVVLRGSGGTTYEWTPATGLSDPKSANPIATPNVNTTYTLKVTSFDGCEDTDEVTINVLPRIKIVNTFSPNRDGVNEYWEIENIANYPDATVEIFNRYGAQVFKSNGYAQPWDGTHNGSPLPLATYYYIIRLNKDEKPFTGSVTIIK
ncbi:gliding motility-associated C-terminal domain-containing protein [Sabulibacter ruber]|uniref:Ig-like domain-containing protein n=1 Tax=Sabulibacter ruber TaxID=2811901 RepID=UPI001A9737ED|nr:gliding motility-associated C-terminal domain-containing protein [Sabulibacter ruber]